MAEGPGTAALAAVSAAVASTRSVCQDERYTIQIAVTEQSTGACGEVQRAEGFVRAPWYAFFLLFPGESCRRGRGRLR